MTAKPFYVCPKCFASFPINHNQPHGSYPYTPVCNEKLSAAYYASDLVREIQEIWSEYIDSHNKSTDEAHRGITDHKLATLQRLLDTLKQGE